MSVLVPKCPRTIYLVRPGTGHETSYIADRASFRGLAFASFAEVAGACLWKAIMSRIGAYIGANYHPNTMVSWNRAVRPFLFTIYGVRSLDGQWLPSLYLFRVDLCLYRLPPS